MANPGELEVRVEALETTVAHQERIIEELNTTIAGQWKEIDALKRRLGRLDEELREIESGMPPPANQRPPHY